MVQILLNPTDYLSFYELWQGLDERELRLSRTGGGFKKLRIGQTDISVAFRQILKNEMESRK